MEQRHHKPFGNLDEILICCVPFSIPPFHDALHSSFLQVKLDVASLLFCIFKLQTQYFSPSHPNPEMLLLAFTVTSTYQYDCQSGKQIVNILYYEKYICIIV